MSEVEKEIEHNNDDRRESLLLIDDHEEEVSINGQKVRRRGIYLLPNLFTTAALFAGFYAIVSGMRGQFETAAIAIFVAGVLDGMDGRVARLTNTQSKFGEQYDSLADMVSFGVAPALIMFSWSLGSFGKLGWAATFIYIACAALRLARFNTQIATTDKNYFTGLASPAAAAVIAGTIWVCADEGLFGGEVSSVLSFFSAVLTAVIGLLMIVNIRYNSFKGIDLRGRVPFVVMILIVIGFGLVSVDPPRILLGIALAYALSGPVMAVYRRTQAS
ncbi:CDP-diacylglycerol--serine O-phosphatidyltransferase [Litorivivens sp.]|uniref:CDP-diacylglycerol--serine O-phosphatidyltransferase n=1 Tax=Litorivivens sp. TaxID=2020868 RepID=UPI00356744B9